MGEFTDRAKGKAKEIEGELTGDDLRKGQGVAEQIKGNVKGVANKIGNAAKNIKDTVKGAANTDDDEQAENP
jgi:uncharacterized protein YjbJ (UPF0337 family)